MFEDEADALDQQIYNMIAAQVKSKNADLISADNEFHYSHGGIWTHIDVETGARNVGTFVEHSAESSTPTSRIIDNDVSAIVDFIREMSEKMHAQAARSVYDLISESSDRIGNTVNIARHAEMSEEEEDAAAISGLDALFDKLELAVDRFGAVTYPQLHIHPGNSAMIRALTRKAAEGPDEGTEERLRKKEIEALGVEAQRLRKFRRE